MDGIASYEQKTPSDNGPDKHNRIIIVNRRNSKNLQLRANRYPNFPSNELVTSKYTLLNFLPKNLFEQFRRLANFYFLIIALLQSTSPSSPVGPSTSLMPLAFVISATAIKQAYEDYLRHKVDDEINRRLVCVLRDKKIVKIKSKEIIVGDIVYITNNEELPCDAILLASSCDERCHVTTANLDGETNLKLRNCFQIKHQIGNIEKIDDSILILECDQPNATLYEFNGYLRTPKDEETANYMLDNWSLGSMSTTTTTSPGGATTGESRRASVSSSSGRNLSKSNKFSIFKSKLSSKEKPPPSKSNKNDLEQKDCIEIGLETSNLLLRASRLKNTAYIYCLATYTGKDTKVAYNSLQKPNKFSSIEYTVNRFLAVCFIILMLFTTVSTVLFKKMNVWYLNGMKSDSVRYDQIFLSHFLIFNYLIPISLYVTLEFVKFIGTLEVVNDKEMRSLVPDSGGLEQELKNTTSDKFSKSYSGSSNKMKPKTAPKIKFIWEKPKCNSSDLNEELGQVQVLFSDKTGTLTENRMVFRACSAFGSLFRSSKKQRLYYQPPDVEPIDIPPIISRLKQINTNRQALLSPHTPESPLLGRSRHTSPAANSQSTSSSGLSAETPELKRLQLIKDLSKNDKIIDFFTCLILCSTVNLNESDKLEDCLPYRCANQYEYRSASPDEESLVSAAHKFGITVCKSNDRECHIIINNTNNQTPPPNKLSGMKNLSQSIINSPQSEYNHQVNNGNYIIKHYERLCIFEFNSIRKRMSVVYRDTGNNKIYMATKGSEEMLDCIKLNGLSSENERIVNVTMAHFEAFAKSGLRTLLVAKKNLSQSDCDKILHDLKDAMQTIGPGRSQRISLVHEKAELELTLVGATAVEDCLQDGVPETIADLKTAGIKVWLLTGDKVETATSVAYLCKLLDHDMTQFQLVRQQNSESCGQLLEQYKQQIDNVLKTKRPPVFKTDGSEGESSPTSPGSSNKLETKSTSITAMNLDPRFLARHHELQAKMQQIELPYKFALITDGRSLYYAMKSHKQLLANLCEHCTSVLGCRLSPMQKAELVKMIKDTPNNPVTAAIGDGANDVSMIQEAHVGIGVIGREGRQAANSSDFAIGRFKLLRRLLFVHGQLFYVRSARTINYFFYKNVIFILPQFIYGFFNCFSGHTIYSPLMLIGYNLMFTSLPILIYGLTEKHIPVQLLENFPRLYRIIRNNSLMSTNLFLMSIALALLQASIIFYSMYHIWGSHTPLLESGRMSGIDGYSTVLFFIIIFLASAQIMIITRTRTIWFNLAVIFSIVALPLVLYLHELANWQTMNLENNTSGQFSIFGKSSMFWLAIFVLTSLGFIPALILGIIESTNYYKEVSDHLMQ